MISAYTTYLVICPLAAIQEVSCLNFYSGLVACSVLERPLNRGPSSVNSCLQTITVASL